MPVTGVLAAKAFLSDTSLALFVFLIAKIATQEQQLQECQEGYMYLFLLFHF